MGLATKQQLSDTLTRRRYEQFSLPVSGLEVRIQSLLESERQAYEMLAFNEQDEFDRDLARVRMGKGLMALSLVDENGQRLFTDAEIDSMPDYDAADANVIISAARILSGLNFSVSDSKKNSGGAAGGEPCSA